LLTTVKTCVNIITQSTNEVNAMSYIAQIMETELKLEAAIKAKAPEAELEILRCELRELEEKHNAASLPVRIFPVFL